jgi:hypothetical protein
LETREEECLMTVEERISLAAKNLAWIGGWAGNALELVDDSGVLNLEKIREYLRHIRGTAILVNSLLLHEANGEKGSSAKSRLEISTPKTP